MSVEVACTCGGLPAHSHLPTRWAVVDGVYQGVYDDEWYVRVWVDWKAYARALGPRRGGNVTMTTNDLPFVPGALRALARHAERGDDWPRVARDLRAVAERIDEATSEERTR